MTKTRGKNPIDLNRAVSIGGDVHLYFDGVALWLTSANPLSDEMSRICLDASTLGQLNRFAKDRVGGDFAAAAVRVAKDS
jgi:hypothetical protein